MTITATYTNDAAIRTLPSLANALDIAGSYGLTGIDANPISGILRLSHSQGEVVIRDLSEGSQKRIARLAARAAMYGGC